jgi:hypothetical protein
VKSFLRPATVRRAAMQGLNIPAKSQFSLNARAIQHSLARIYSRHRKSVSNFSIQMTYADDKLSE